MSYTPDEQLLSPSITKILEGMKEFEAAAIERAASEDYTENHLAELSDTRKKLLDLRTKLEKLKRETR